MTNRLSGVLAFVQAVEAGSFALAAERMGLSRSAIGKGIARLEERLGTRLFQRTRQEAAAGEGPARCRHRRVSADWQHGRMVMRRTTAGPPAAARA